jgi:hypothetical protein
MKNQLGSTVVLMLLVTGCATTPLRSEFEDVPLPTGLTYQPQRSVVIQSPTVKAAELVYRGRLEPVSLGLAMRTLVEANGWRHVNTTTTATDGTRQVYDKGGNALEVHIYEGVWFTYLTLGVAEALGAGTAQDENGGPRVSAETAPSPVGATNPLTASGDASVSAPPAHEPPPTSDRTARSSDPSFTRRLKDFFANLFSR